MYRRERKGEVFRKRNKGVAGSGDTTSASALPSLFAPDPSSSITRLCGIEGHHLQKPWTSTRTQTARETPLGGTGKPAGTRKVRTVSFVHLETLTSSSPPPPGHLTSPGKDAKPDSWEDGVTCHSSSSRLRLVPAQVALNSWVPRRRSQDRLTAA